MRSLTLALDNWYSLTKMHKSLTYKNSRVGVGNVCVDPLDKLQVVIINICRPRRSTVRDPCVSFISTEFKPSSAHLQIPKGARSKKYCKTIRFATNTTFTFWMNLYFQGGKIRNIQKRIYESDCIITIFKNTRRDCDGFVIALNRSRVGVRMLRAAVRWPRMRVALVRTERRLGPWTASSKYSIIARTKVHALDV